MMDKVLCANLTDVPKLSPNVIKIYVASTNEDFTYERQRLWEDTLPELQHHLLSYGLDVQLVDIHQGARYDHAYNRQLFDQHLQLIKHCHKVSTGAFFLCLVGQKHGKVPLPGYIEEYEFKHIRDEAVQAGKDVKLLEKWYVKDSNAIPPVYALQPVTASYSSLSIGHYENNGKYYNEISEWEKVYNDLLDLLQHCAQVCYKEGRINQEHGHRQQRFFMSTVEQEIQQAMQLSVANPLVVIRTLESMVWKDPDIKTYINMTSQGEVDVSAQQRMKQFKEIIHDKLGKDNKILLTVPWKRSGLSPSKYESHLEYLESFHTTVVNKILAMVDRQRQLKTPLPPIPNCQKESPSYIFEEVKVHSKYCRRILRKTRPRGFEELEDKLKKVIAIHGKEEHHTILLHGPNGCGKTMLVSRLAQQAVEVLGRGSYAIVRYTALTSKCKTIYSLLLSICTQMEIILNSKSKMIALNLNDLVQYFLALVNLLSEGGHNVVIAVDGIHNLRPNQRLENNTVNTDWLTEKLPPGIHIIISLLNNKRNAQVFNTLQGKLGEGETVFAIPPLKENHVHQILKDRFVPLKRKLTVDQEGTLVAACMTDDDCRPLHVKLCIDQALLFTSSTQMVNNTFKPSLEKAINHVFECLEAKYGEELICLISCYFCACYCGLTEMELLDILSCNNKALLCVLKHIDFTEHNVLLRFPTILWWAIRTDFGSFLQFVYVDNKKLIRWSHQLVTQIAIQRYRPSIDTIKETHRDISSLFSEKWIGNKPMVIPEKGIEIIDTGNRIVSQQPLLYSDTLYNYRRLHELWFQQLHTGDITQFKESTMCNFEYILACLHSSSVNNLLSDFEMIMAHVLDADLAIIQQSICYGSKILSYDPLQLAAEMIGQIRQIKEFFPCHIDSLVQQCMEWCDSYTLPLLVPLSSWLQDPRQHLVKTIKCTQPVELICTTANNQHVFCTTKDNHVYMYHVASSSLVRKLSGPAEHITCMCVSHSRQMLYCGSEDKTVHIWDITTGTLVHFLKEHQAGVLCMALAIDSSIIVTGSNDKSFKVMRADTYDVLHTKDDHKHPVKNLLLSQGDVRLITADSNCKIMVWLIEDMTLLNTIEEGIPSSIKAMALSCDNTFLIIGCEDKQILVKAFTTGTEIHQLEGINCQAHKIMISNDSKHCVIAGSDGDVYTYNFRSKGLVHQHTKHDIDTGGDRYPVTCIDISSDEHFIFSVSHDEICLWSFYKDKLKCQTSDKHTDMVTCMALSQDGKTGITGSRDCTVKLWNLEILDFVTSWEGHVAQVTCVDIAHDDTFAASGSEDTTIKVWSIIMGSVITDYRDHRSSILQVCALSEPSRVISAEEDGIVKMWKAEDGETLMNMEAHVPLCKVSPSLTHVVSGDPREFLRVWLINDGELVGQKIHHSDAISCVSYSADSQLMVTGSADNSLKVWEACSAKLTQVLVEHEGYISCAEISHDNSLVISGSYDKRLLIWNLSTGTVEQQLLGHTSPVTCVKITQDATIAVSGSLDETLRVWNTHHGGLITMFDMHAAVFNLFLTPNADRIMVHLQNSQHVPLMCLHNTPAEGIKSQSDIEVQVNCDSILPIKPKPLLPHVPSTVYSKPRKKVERQASVSTLPEIIKLSPIKKAPILGTVKAQEVNQEKRIARELSSIGSNAVKERKAKKSKKESSPNSSLCVLL